MSDFFSNFGQLDYAFGDDFMKKGGAKLVLEIFQDLTAYVNILDDIKDVSSFYTKYYILENDRPDQVSYKIYGSPNYHWTFYLMNDHIRRQGWPLSMKELDAKIKRDFPHKYIRTLDNLTGIMLPDQYCYGAISSGGGKILRRNLDQGVIIVDSKDPFRANERVSHVAYSGVTKAITVKSTGYEYNAPRFYEDADGEVVDIDPYSNAPAIYNEVTQYDFYVRENDKLKEIKVIRPDAIQEIVNNYYQALQS